MEYKKIWKEYEMVLARENWVNGPKQLEGTVTTYYKDLYSDDIVYYHFGVTHAFPRLDDHDLNEL